MRVIARSTLLRYAAAHARAAAPLQAWYAEARRATWATPQDVKIRYPSASVLPHDRVVFNLGGNAYRLVCHVRYDLGIVFIRFIGTHAEYDRIDAATV